MNNLVFEDLEIISAITILYEDDIKTKLLEEKGKVLQEDFAQNVYEIYQKYLDLKIDIDLLDLVNKKYITIMD